MPHKRQRDFVVTGPDEAAVARAAEGIRYRVAFYGSTPAYRSVLDLHGHGELADRLHQMTRRGEWSEMPRQVSDEVLDLFIARITYDKLPEAIEKRFGGVVDSVSFEFLPDDPPGVRRRVVEAVRKIPHRFQAFRAA